MKNVLILGGLLLGFMLLRGQSQQTNPVLEPKVYAEELKKENVILLDVRTPEEYSDGHLKGAVLIDYQDSTFETKVSKFDKNKPVYLYCRTDRRSEAAQEVMLKQGFKKVTNLKGGILAWQKAGLP